MDPIKVGQQIQKAYPQYANTDAATLGNKYLSKYGGAVQSVQSGQIKISDIPEAQRTGVSIGLNAVGYKPEQDSAAEKEAKVKKDEKLTKIKELSSNIKELEKSRREMKIKGPGSNLVPFRSALDPNIRGFETTRNIVAYTMAGALADQTGRGLSDQDFQTFFNALPKDVDTDQGAEDAVKATLTLFENKLRAEGASEDDVKQYIGTVRKDLGYDKKKKDQSVAPINNQQGGGGGGQFGALANLVKPGGLASGPQGFDVMNSPIGQLLSPRVSQTYQDLQQNKPVSPDQALGAAGEYGANLLTGGVGKLIPRLAGAGVLHGATTPGASAQDRTMLGAGEGLAGGLLGLLGVGAGRGKDILSGSAKNLAAETRNKIAEESKITLPVKQLIDEGNRIASNLPATAAKWEQEIAGLAKDAKPIDLIEKIDFWGQAFKASGELKDTASAKLYGALQRKAKEILKEKAPEVFKAHEKLRQEAALKNIPNKLKSGLFYGGAATGLLSGGAYLASLLKGNR